MIIGITGTLGAGKGTVVEYLQTKGFQHYSVRTYLTKKLEQENKTVNRDTLREKANDIRTKKGASHIIKTLYQQAKKKGKDAIIESIRTTGEVQSLKTKKDFILFAVDAEQQLRYERIKKRNNETDNVTYKEFQEQEKKEMNNKEPTKQNIKACIEQADYILTNNGTKKELEQKITAILGKKGEEEYKRPSWDEYFMDIVQAVAKRGTCDRGRTAVVVVKDKVILVTGYVGSPQGTPHCSEAGHLIKEVKHEKGNTSQHCMRTNHAEVNAVALAAKKGIAIEGATMYMKMSPCYTCAKMLINTGIKRIVCNNKYHQTNEAITLMKEAGIQIDLLNNETEYYEGQ